MLILNTSLPKLFIIKLEPKKDNRGSFTRLFCENFLKKTKFKVKQINISKNLKSKTLRGFHYQDGKYAESKIITPIKGKVLLQFININKNSKFYLKKYKITVSDKSNKAMHVPADCATAFMTLKPNTNVLYLMSNFFNPKIAKGIMYNDKKTKVKWPFKPSIISKKDLSYTLLK
jgi:dTDP-4-dehydrorhamnose 3,5-epimerase